jgi:hypothetical protein
MHSIRHAFPLATIALAVSAAAAIPTAAFAAGRVETGTFPIEDHFIDPGASDFWGFPVSVDVNGTGRFEVFLDAAGNATSVAVHINRTGTLSGNGVSLTEFDRINLFFDSSGGQTDAGIEFRVSAGGAPLVFDRGRLIFDADGNVTFVAGPHPALDGDFQAVCDALGG